MTQELIAIRTGLSEPTLRKYYFRELDHGAKIIRAEVLAAQIAKAKTGNTPAAKLVLEILARGENADFIKEARAPAPRAAKVGKKEEAQQAAQTAGQDTDWGDDLRVH